MRKDCIHLKNKNFDNIRIDMFGFGQTLVYSFRTSVFTIVLIIVHSVKRSSSKAVHVQVSWSFSKANNML